MVPMVLMIDLRAELELVSVWGAPTEVGPRLTAVAKATGGKSSFGHRIAREDGVNAKYTVGYLGNSEIDDEAGKSQRLSSLQL